ncbi:MULTISPECIES: flagellar biosynthesis repressor FlbT [unclassified Hyphomonas]|uniref:flagellar biosynthesis repressor FlbT n=2 Tax=Hyphomonas TaxID=85 RepID=UPI000C61619B|nr:MULTISPECIES: flagellar biosynthesis repressor FlbT [unclassified Hyphomonas]MAN92303.1 flagellar biosynthesis repressor FlbT [Hyphomonadaceae bacterium]MAA82255.1 flagellar biosynthesis repressor FlbT [Hyphomonas sp.]MAL44700.1 flagellar biosynthesis repressor FlbT [Hyphomonas sp.]MAX84080.1 flagellar biosynthesis repressor FlbT [Hyphomonas sp.]HAO36610.1 flagellar biosynthesis repressor FlbT [Hyphomonas sp.]
MSGLVLKLAAGERFVVNGAMLENGDKPSTVRVVDDNARILRCRDALKPQDVDTPTKRVYYAIQLIITGDLQEDDVLPAILDECERLEDVFESIDRKLLSVLRSMLDRGNFYSALCHLRNIIAIEAELLKVASLKTQFTEQAQVA